jgi:iron complex outermembrane recepter protein
MAMFSRMTSIQRTSLTASAAALAIGLASPAFAQDAAEEEENVNEEIIVTAQFREQNVQDTPLAITVVNAAMMEARSQTDLLQIANQAPNVTLAQQGAAFGPSLGASIRGIGQFDFNPAYEPGVGMYVDDVYYATLTGGVFDLLDLERVEVLRGPQGTLTGRNSIGGAIKLYSKRPTGDGSGYVEAAYGSRNRIDLRASADFKLAENLFARLAGVYKTQEGYVDRLDYGCANPGNAAGIAPTRGPDGCTIDKLGDKGYAGIKGTLRYEPSDALDITLIGDYTHEKRANSPDVLIYGQAGLFVDPVTAAFQATNNPTLFCGRSCNYVTYSASTGGPFGAFAAPSETEFDGWGVSGQINLKLSDSLSLSSITAYRKYDTTFGTDDDFTPFDSFAGTGFNHLTHDFFSQELRLNGEMGEMVSFTLGAFYSDQKTVYETIQQIRYFGLEFYGNDPVNADSKAAYGSVFIKPAENMTISAGLRYTDESKDYTFVRRAIDGGPFVQIGPFDLSVLDGITSRYSGNKLDWRLSLDYRFSPEVLAYATVATGFKGGGVTARPFTAAHALLGTFDPETLVSYEAGLKTDLLDRRLRLNLAAFISQNKNVQGPIADCSALDGVPGIPCAVVANVGKVRYSGFEAELFATPAEGLQFDAALSYLKAKQLSLDPRAGSGVVAGDPATNAPKWKFSAGIQYTADLGSSGSLTPRIDVAYTGKSYQGRIFNALTFPLPAAQYFLPSYTLGNARLTWENEEKDLSMSLEVQNLFKEYYYSAVFGPLHLFTGTGYATVGRPREWAVTVKKKF